MTIDLWIEPITRTWPLLLGLLAATGAWWKLNSRVETIGQEVTAMDARMKQAEARAAEQDVRLARGDVMLDTLVRQLGRVEAKIDRVLERRASKETGE